MARNSTSWVANIRLFISYNQDEGLTVDQVIARTAPAIPAAVCTRRRPGTFTSRVHIAKEAIDYLIRNGQAETDNGNRLRLTERGLRLAKGRKPKRPETLWTKVFRYVQEKGWTEKSEIYAWGKSHGWKHRTLLSYVARHLQAGNFKASGRRVKAVRADPISPVRRYDKPKKRKPKQ